MKRNKINIHYIIILGVSILLLLFLIRTPLISTHDATVHILRIIGVDHTINIGQFPPIISPYYGSNFGYAINLFYGSLVTYGPLIIKLFTLTYVNALKIFTFITIFLSGFFMYKFTNQVTSNKNIALISSILYIVAPYKLSNIYIRFAIGEFTALMFVPLVFLGLYNLFNQDAKKHYYISIGAIGLILTHTISAVYTAIFCFIYVLFNIKKLREIKIIKLCIINIIFILLVTAFFTVPILEHMSEGEYTIFNDIMFGEAETRVIEIQQYFVDKVDSYGSKLCFRIGILTIILLIIGIFVYKKIDNKYLNFYTIFCLLIVLTIFMTTKLFPWSLMPSIIYSIQFPWRLVGFLVFFTSFVCGVNMYLFTQAICKTDKMKLIIYIIVITLIILYTIYIIMTCISYNTETGKKYIEDYKYEQNILENPSINYYQINRDYLPLSAIEDKDYWTNREDKTLIIEGNANIENENKNLTNLTLQMTNVEKDTIIELPYMFYLNYEVKLRVDDQEQILEKFSSDKGFVAVKLPQFDQGTINFRYRPTNLMILSYIISALSIIMFIIYIRRTNINEKQTIREK